MDWDLSYLNVFTYKYINHVIKRLLRYMFYGNIQKMSCTFQTSGMQTNKSPLFKYTTNRSRQHFR